MAAKPPKKSQKRGEILKEKNIPSKKRSPARWEDTLAGFEQDLLRRRRSEATIKAYCVQINKFQPLYQKKYAIKF
jgi:hypothetical protein